jgi:hypothetical protein
MASPGRTRAGAPVFFTVIASERHATGAISYRLAYGDGAAAGSGATPMFCIAGNAPPAHQTWRLAHRYTVAASYRASLSVRVNCSRDHAATSVTVSVIRG